MESLSQSCIPGDVSSKLKLIISAPLMYPDFPEIPRDIFFGDIKLLGSYSLYKKGTMYFVLDDGKSEYNEGFDILDVSKIVFDFTQYELDSPHIGLIIREKIQNIVDTDGVEDYEVALGIIISRKLYNTFSEYFGVVLSNKLFALAGIYGDSIYSYLMKISLIPIHGNYVVLDSDIHFSKQELEQIKSIVFV